MQTHTTDSNKAIRKNFTMADEAVRDLDFLATVLNKNRSQIIQELVRREAELRRNELRLTKLQQMKGLLTNQIGEKSIQIIKSERQL